jgi:hypothetical protein
VKRLLFVCVGNSWRSQIAEALLAVFVSVGKSLPKLVARAFTWVFIVGAYLTKSSNTPKLTVLSGENFISAKPGVLFTLLIN